MRVHGTHLNSSATDLYAAEAAEKVAAAQRAAEVRKKLKAGASKNEDELDADAVFNISEESDSEESKDPSQVPDKKIRVSRKKKQNAEEAPPADPLSMWG